LESYRRKLARWERQRFQGGRRIAKVVEVELQPVLRVQNILDTVQGAEALVELEEEAVVAAAAVAVVAEHEY